MTIRFKRPHLSKKQWVGLLAPPLMVLATVGLIIYGKGYNLNFNNRSLDKTGMLVVKSQPDGAKIFLDGEWKSATPNTFSNLRPKTYLLRVEKDGFSTWEKWVAVYPEMVTDMTAVLVSTGPKFEPLTIGGASQPVFNNTTHAIAYTTTQSKPGLWILPTGRPLPITLFQSTPTLVMPDTETTKYSAAQALFWSPPGDEILAQISPSDYRLIDINQSKELEATSSAQPTLQAWQAAEVKKRAAFLASQALSLQLTDVATAPTTVWSPDERKFYYLWDNGNGTVNLSVHNMESPIPVDEKADYITATFAKDHVPTIVWYPDSYHFILKEGQSLYLIRIDGTNKAEIYSGVMDGAAVFVTPGGTKVIISASFKKDAPPELYAVSLR